MIETVPLSQFSAYRDAPSWWSQGAYVGPGVHIPPCKEDCRCDCSKTDDLGRPITIGWCGPDCERRLT